MENDEARLRYFPAMFGYAVHEITNAGKERASDPLRIWTHNPWTGKERTEEERYRDPQCRLVVPPEGTCWDPLPESREEKRQRERDERPPRRYQLLFQSMWVRHLKPGP